MRKADIDRKFDAIVAFAEVEKFLDTPVKHYSSGMYMRLAFAVAAHLEAEILMIDEVLAVGDAAFQQKSMGKMGDVATQGRTVLLVSHNMTAIRQLCSRAILIDHGRIVKNSTTGDVLQAYGDIIGKKRALEEDNLADRLDRTNGAARFVRFELVDESGKSRVKFNMGETIRIDSCIRVYQPIPNLLLYIEIRYGLTGEVVSTIAEVVVPRPVNPSETFHVEIELPNVAIRPGGYAFSAGIADTSYQKVFDVIDENVSLPWMEISSDDPDVHRTIGYFTVPAHITVTPTEE